MLSIFNLFLTIIGYSAIITVVAPVISSILARRKGIKFNFELKLFEFYIYVAATGQILAVIVGFVSTVEVYIWIMRVVALVEISTFVFLLLKWMNKQKYYSFLMLFIIPILFLGEYLLKSDFPDFMLYFEIVILLILSFSLSYIIDKGKLNLKKEYSYIFIGIYLYAIITLMGITPIHSHLRYFGHVLHVTANFLTNYYFYRSFRCLYP